MQAWYLNENPYPFVPPHVLDAAESVRGSLPNRYCDPKIAADLFQEALDEYLLCDDVGINVVSNEHHAGINCLFGASPLILGILARQTRNVRILSLGTLITVRTDPVRVAEEYATADVISRGRLEIGFVKSGGTEMASGNANPIGIVDRFWEAIDLIRKALSHRDGPFSWEGKHFTHRHVNIWPGPWQQPHPPLWAATGDPTTSAELGRRGIVNVMVFRTAEETARAWAAYRKARADAGLAPPGPDRFGHTAFVYTADTDEEGVRVGSKLLWFLNTALRSAPQYSKFLPGAVPAELAPALYTTKPRPGVPAAARPAAGLIGVTAEQAMAKGLMFAGNPDSVYRQIQAYRERVGPFEHLVLASRSGFMTHTEATKGLKLFAREVLPRLREL
ncbi:MAG TPA: LLM class flavin-dependent oxidoreductase [Methylomirabilota bacterium]|nr:LLM class flavin-dependent oxidoreductase [Methylomirabilota bacterium]